MEYAWQVQQSICRIKCYARVLLLSILAAWYVRSQTLTPAKDYSAARLSYPSCPPGVVPGGWASGIRLHDVSGGYILYGYFNFFAHLSFELIPPSIALKEQTNIKYKKYHPIRQSNTFLGRTASERHRLHTVRRLARTFPRGSARTVLGCSRAASRRRLSWA